MRRLLVAVATFACLVVTAQPATAQKDVFSFVPPGGKSLLLTLVRSKPPLPELRGLLTAKHTQQEWQATLLAKRQAIPALVRLSDTELATLASYLFYTAPLDQRRLPNGHDLKEWQKALPPDGRDLALNYCQFCHIITVVVTQAKERQGWQGTMNTPSHVVVKLSPKEREALASYLALNAPVPLESIPEELRAGGASY